jgi:hypothetical protein
MYVSTLSLSSDTPEEGIRSHYRWLWATMWLLGIELRMSGRAVSAFNLWAISPAPVVVFVFHSFVCVCFFSKSLLQKKPSDERRACEEQKSSSRRADNAVPCEARPARGSSHLSSRTESSLKSGKADKFWYNGRLSHFPESVPFPWAYSSWRLQEMCLEPGLAEAIRPGVGC